MKHNVCVYYEGRFHNDQNHILEKKSFGSGIKKKLTILWHRHFDVIKEKSQNLIDITPQENNNDVKWTQHFSSIRYPELNWLKKSMLRIQKKRKINNEIKIGKIVHLYKSTPTPATQGWCISRLRGLHKNLITFY